MPLSKAIKNVDIKYSLHQNRLHLIGSQVQLPLDAKLHYRHTYIQTILNETL